MQLSITFRHFDGSDSLKDFARERVERVNKFLDRPGEAHVVLWIERHLHFAEIRLQSGSYLLRGKEKSADMYASIEGAMDKIERQLLRYKDKLKQHHHGREASHHHAQALARVRHDVVAIAPPEASHHAQEAEAVGPRVIRSNDLVAKPMSVDEAVMQMDLMNNDFLVFTHAETHEVNVVYRRKDGHYGLIETRAARAADQRPAAIRVA